MSTSEIHEEVSSTRRLIGTLTLPVQRLRTFQNTSGAVRLYYDHGLGMKVVGKRVDTLDRPLLARLAEPQLQARLDHPNLARVLSATEVRGGPEHASLKPLIEIITPYYEDGSVHDAIIADLIPWPVSRVIAMAKAVASGLAELHSNGVVHRDMKSSNIFLTGAPSFAVVGDLGEAAPLSCGTAPGIATAHPWTAPEQLANDVAFPSTDLYGLGMTMIEALRGGFDYEAYDLEAGLKRLRQGRRALADRELVLPVTTPKRLRLLIARLSHRDPGSRLSAHATLDALAATFYVDWISTVDEEKSKRWEASLGSRRYAVEASWRPGLKKWDCIGYRRLNAWHRTGESVRTSTLFDPALVRVFDRMLGTAHSDAR